MLVPPMVEEDMVAPKEVGMVRMAVEVVVEEAVEGIVLLSPQQRTTTTIRSTPRRH